MSLTWLELYNYLCDKANKLENVGIFNWQDEIVIHNATTGEEVDGVDIFQLGDKTVLIINSDTIFESTKES